MQQFIFIFRQGKVSLPEEQLKQRAEEVRAWALHLRDQGHELHPYITGGEHVLVPPATGATPESGDRVTAVLVVNFASLEEARKSAEAHPGRRYGVSVEVLEAQLPPAVPQGAR